MQNANWHRFDHWISEFINRLSLIPDKSVTCWDLSLKNLFDDYIFPKNICLSMGLITGSANYKFANVKNEKSVTWWDYSIKL